MTFLKWLNKSWSEVGQKTKIISSLIVLFVFNIIVNGPIKILALVQDDLSYWQLFDLSRSDFFAFIFNVGANKFRPVLNVVTFILFYTFGASVWLFSYFNLFFSFVIASVLFYFFYRISKNVWVALALGTVFLASHLAYYNISQVFGIMEAMGILLASITLFFLWKFLNSQVNRYYWVGLITFTSLIFVHERYLTLVLLFFITMLMIKFKRKNLLLMLLPVLPVIINLGLKVYVLKVRPLDGTSGTAIADTFNFRQFISFFFSGCKYLVGINDGPAYLSGIPYSQAPAYIHAIVIIGIVLLISVLSFFFISLFSGRDLAIKIKKFILFFTFIICTLTAASVTFRLEMRWLYISFVGLLFLLSYVMGVLIKEKKHLKILLPLFFLWLLMVSPTEMYYRKHYKNLYFWGNQAIGNEIYQKTLSTYGNNFWSYKTYIITDLDRLPLYTGNDLTSNTNAFFKQFAGRKYEPNVTLVKKYPTRITGRTLIFQYDENKNSFMELK